MADTYEIVGLNISAALTKRELLAAMAMQGIIANSEMSRQAGSSPPSIANHAVCCADALLAELAKGGES